MATEPIFDQQRRKLLAATAVSGGAVLAGTTVVLVQSMGPSEAAKAAGAPVDVDLGKVAPGMLVTAEWRGLPMWVLHRTEQMLATLDKHNDRLLDPFSEQEQQPDYAKNPTRSIRPAFMVMTAICTHLGCVPAYRPEIGAAGMGEDWTGGFYCPCHGSRFDLAGRVFKNVPAPRNLEVPPHEYIDDQRIRIGVDRGHPA